MASTASPRGTQNNSPRRLFIIVSITVFIPLAAMIGLQYVWLNNLQEAATLEQRNYLQKKLSSIRRDVDFEYWLPAEKMLAGASESLITLPVVKLAKKFHRRTIPFEGDRSMKKRKDPVEGIRYLFYANYKGDGNIWVFDVYHARMMPLPMMPKEVREALNYVTLYWAMMAKKGEKPNLFNYRKDFSNPELPVILNPIPDDEGHLVGLMGLILDMSYYEHEVLQRVVRSNFSDEEWETISVGVLNRQNQTVFRSSLYGEHEDGAAFTRGNLNLVFAGFAVLMSGGPPINDWAGSSLLFNIVLSLVLAMTLTAGMLFTLRTASHEMQVSQMKNDFVSNVSHELRTPLASIRVFGELLRLGRIKDEGKVREYGAFIETESRRLTQLINNILDFSKIETGHKSYNMESTDIRDVMTRVLKVFEVRLQDKGPVLNYDEGAVAPPMITIDPDAVGQAVFNLVDNAVKYGADSESIEIKLAMENESLAVSVKDYGIGIPREEQEKIFDRFHRISTNLVHDVKGSGLGLSIASHVVSAHGGRIDVESEVGEGSLFTIRLPLHHREETAGSVGNATV